MKQTWDGIRGQFPAAKNFVYLDAASASPISKPAADAARRFYDDALASGSSNFGEWLASMEKVRGKVARLINADRSEIAFIPNTSYGMNLVARMLQGKGDGLTMDEEFASTTLPWLNQGFRLHFVKPINHTYHLDSIENAVAKGIRILVSSHVQFSTGFRQDLAGLGMLCKKHDLVHVVNATQSIGAMPIDVKESNIDFLVFSSVKWLMTGMGIGAVYISKKWHDKSNWPVAGWLSVKDLDGFDNKHLELKEDASALEIGAPCFPSIFALGAAIGLVDGIGRQEIEDRIHELGDYLIGKLEAMGLELISPLDKRHRAGIVVIKVKDPEAMVLKLRSKNILVSSREGGLRVSFHIYNNAADLDRFVEALAGLI